MKLLFATLVTISVVSFVTVIALAVGAIWTAGETGHNLADTAALIFFVVTCPAVGGAMWIQVVERD